jgi:hypothetical protein
MSVFAAQLHAIAAQLPVFAALLHAIAAQMPVFATLLHAIAAQMPVFAALLRDLYSPSSGFVIPRRFRKPADFFSGSGNLGVF